MNKIFRKGCQVGCLSIILLGIFIWAAIASQSCVIISNKYSYNKTNNNNTRISIITHYEYQAEWFNYYEGSPYSFTITVSPYKGTNAFIGLRYVKFINKTRPGMTIEIYPEFMEVDRNDNYIVYLLNKMAIPYDDYDVLICYTYEENGATKDEETSLELKREPSIKRGNYFIGAIMSV